MTRIKANDHLDYNEYYNQLKEAENSWNKEM